MLKTITCVYDSKEKVINTVDELISWGLEREKIYTDDDRHEVKVMIPEAIEPAILHILKRHNPTQVR
ncbi:MAG: hypothetical protein M3Z21_07520 [Pseudomonadota bacterium]|nr:hypothetical protein [Pseudomonadota bacterium]